MLFGLVCCLLFFEYFGLLLCFLFFFWLWARPVGRARFRCVLLTNLRFFVWCLLRFFLLAEDSVILRLFLFILLLLIMIMRVLGML